MKNIEVYGVKVTSPFHAASPGLPEGNQCPSFMYVYLDRFLVVSICISTQKD